MIRITASLAFASIVASAWPASASAQDALSEWSRVRTLRAGEQIIVTTVDAEPSTRYFVDADESGLTFVQRAAKRTTPAPETIARDSIAQITIRRRGRGFWGHVGPLGGFFIGGMAGGYAFRLINRRPASDTGTFLDGMVFGGVFGGAYGLYAAVRETETVVYRAP